MDRITLTQAQIDALEWFQVREAVEAYFNALDRRDDPALAACFAENVEAAYHVGTPDERSRSGRQAVIEPLFTARNTHLGQNFSVGSVTVTLAGDHADVVTFASINFTMNGRFMAGGFRYEDRYVKQDGNWLILKRKHFRLWEYEVPAIPVDGSRRR